MKELFDDLKIVTGDTVLQLPTKGTILSESSPTIDVESIVSENDRLIFAMEEKWKRKFYY